MRCKWKHIFYAYMILIFSFPEELYRLLVQQEIKHIHYYDSLNSRNDLPQRLIPVIIFTSPLCRQLTSSCRYLFLSITIVYKRFLRKSAVFFCKYSHFINSMKDFCGYPHFSQIEAIGDDVCSVTKTYSKTRTQNWAPYKVISVETNAINSISSNDNNRTYYKANGVKANEYTKGIVVIKDNNRTKVIVKEQVLFCDLIISNNWDIDRQWR